MSDRSYIYDSRVIAGERRVEEGEAEQRLRAEQLPIAERLLAEARREDGRG